MSFVFVVGGSQLLVHGALGVAKELGLSDWLIGVTIGGRGDLEVRVRHRAHRPPQGPPWHQRRRPGGRDIFNLLGVLGIAGLLHPLHVTAAAFSSVVMLMMMMVLLVVVLMRTGWQITRWQGVLLVVLNFGRWALDFRAAG
jgi:cation:H+ antiporter